jgi:hypothetical protein
MNSFDLMPKLSRRFRRVSPTRKFLWRPYYAVLAVLRWIRILKPVTQLLGTQYKPSRSLLEIDITYACNLACHNCNRSVGLAPESRHMKTEELECAVDEWIALGQRWDRIRLLGGEPTLHPRFTDIVAIISRYQKHFPCCLLEVVTNGHGPRVNTALRDLPLSFLVDNSEKSGPIQPHFGPFNLAPLDDANYRWADFSNACSIARDCGIGFTPGGYYPCAVAGGIDRILGLNLGRAAFPSPDDTMTDIAGRLCGMCGRFRDGHHVPRALRMNVTEQRTSPAWITAYDEWRKRKESARA